MYVFICLYNFEEDGIVWGVGLDLHGVRVCGGPDGDRPGFVTPNSKIEPGGVFFNLYCQVNFFNMEFYLEKQ